MSKPQNPYTNKISDSWCSWWKHKRPEGKRNTNKLIRLYFKKEADYELEDMYDE